MSNNIHKHSKKTALIITSILAALVSTNVYSDPLSVEIVKLYSEGKVVGKWEASTKGHMEGQCYVFKIKKSIHTPQVRVCGTFSVEEKR